MLWILSSNLRQFITAQFRKRRIQFDDTVSAVRDKNRARTIFEGIGK